MELSRSSHMSVHERGIVQMLLQSHGHFDVKIKFNNHPSMKVYDNPGNLKIHFVKLKGVKKSC